VPRRPTGNDVVYGMVLAGRTDAAAVLMIVDDQAEAEAIAFELRQRDQRVEVVAIPRRVADGTRD
jgi:hypothetical protein